MGSHVCQAALAQGIPVTSISRSGKPRNVSSSWVEEVDWVTGVFVPYLAVRRSPTIKWQEMGLVWAALQQACSVMHAATNIALCLSARRAFECLAAGDAMQPETYMQHLQACLAVVTCIGLISTSQDAMRKVNGDANKAIIDAAKEAGVSRLAYISAHDYKFPGDLGVAKGYFEGKRAAEAALRSAFPDNGALPGLGL